MLRVETQQHRTWRDRKKYLWVLGLIVPACALLPSTLVALTGQTILWWIGPMLIFGAIPLIDGIVGDDGENPPDEAYEELSNVRFYRWCTYAFLPMQIVAMTVACWLWSFGTLGVVDKLGLAVTIGLVNGIGINAAHELGHRREKHERWLSKAALAPTLYGHFFVEHNRGHHANVATPNDPASSRLGESVWQFIPRSVAGGFRSAWRLERTRLLKTGRSPWSTDNHILQAWLFSAVLFGSLLLAFGWAAAPWLLLQACIAFGLLELVNYVEHYGLLRERLANGRFERCLPRHSWNSDRLVTNIFLFHLQRHSDHHANPGRRYQTLRSNDEAPQLPYGYATMVLLALIPALWRAVMDKRVLAHYGGDITKANVVAKLK